MGVTSGFIGQFQNFSAKALYSSEYEEWFKDSTKKQGYYIGPITFNQLDNSVYIYTQRGFYKCNADAELANAENWSIVVMPELLWTLGQSNATGYGMNVTKMLASGQGAFLFLTEQNGIGYFSGKELRMLQ